jgi:hypothetical protein
MDTLLDQLIRFAQQTLETRGEFYPFAAALTADGSIEMVAEDVGQENPASHELIDALYAELVGRARKGEIRAAGICSDVRLSGTDGRDAIQVAIEHAYGNPVNVFLPYEKQPGGAVEYEPLVAAAGSRRLFS